MTARAIAWGGKVSQEFLRIVVSLADELGCDPNHLMACMAFETGQTFSPSVRNEISGATGLIQFMPRTAVGLGTTVDELAGMAAEDQLRYVYSYFRPFAGRLGTLADVYMTILWPPAVGEPEDYVLFEAGSKAYEQNKGLDIDRDGKITKAECTVLVQRQLDKGMRPGNVGELRDASAQTPPPATPEAVESPNPYDPYAPRPPRPSDPGPIFNPDQQAPDLGAAPGDPHMVPVLPVVLPILSQLLPMMLQLFAPKAQAQLQKITGQPADVVQPFVQDLFNKAGELVGVVPPKAQIETDAQAVRVVAELQKAKSENAALVQQLEQHALDYLDRLAPMFDRLAAADAAANAAAIEGRNAALERALRDPYDVAPAMVHDVTTNTRVIGGGLVIGTVAAIIAKGIWPELPDYAAMIIPAITLLAGQISKERGAIIGYRFDGTPQSSNTASVINAAIAKSLSEKH